MEEKFFFLAELEIKMILEEEGSKKKTCFFDVHFDFPLKFIKNGEEEGILKNIHQGQKDT